jgi:receptor protein-tyrosine kinase
MNIANMPESIITRAIHGTNAGRSIGALLMDAGRITPEAAERILKLQRDKNLRFGEAAIELGLLTENDIQFALSRQFEYPYLMPGDTSINEAVIAAFKPFSPAVERLRALRSQLMLRCLNPDIENRSLAILSPENGDGRSYIAANLAVVFSQLGERTLLIDADLRRPCQHELFCLGNQAGLSAVLSGRAEPEGVISRIPNLLGLSVLPAGAIPPNPQELLGRPAFNKLLEYCRQHYDVVLIDTPASSNADAETIASRAGASLLIGRKHVTSSHRLQELVTSLRRTGAQVVGAVLNEY